MVRRTAPWLLSIFISVAVGGGEAAAAPGPDGVARLLSRLELVVQAGDPQAYSALLSSFANRSLAADFAASAIRPGTTRAALRERERTDLAGTLPGDGYQLIVESLIEAGAEARVSTWALEVKRVGHAGPDGDDGEWVIAGQRVVGTLPTVYRLALDEHTQYLVHDLVVSDEDLRIDVPDADVFIANAAGIPAVVVVFGRGQMRFAPTQMAERGQVKLFCKAETLTAPVDAFFFRVPAGEFERHVSGRFERRDVNARLLQKAADFFGEDGSRSYALDLPDLSRDTWSLLASPGDFLAEIKTRKSGQLTYVRAVRDAEDVCLFERSRHRNIAVYSSAARLATHGRFYSDDDNADYRVLSYDIDASFEPKDRWIEGRTSLRVEVLAPSVNTLALKLGDALAVRSVSSPEYGRLLAVRVRGQNSVVVSLPAPVPAGGAITLDVSYSGRARAQAVDQETMGQLPGLGDADEIQLEESYLFSNQSFWYPQAPSNSYATATLRLRVPEYYSCVASGELVDTSASGAGAPRPSRQFTFVALRPARYFACLITPLVPAASRVLSVEGGERGKGGGVGVGASMRLEIKANPRLQRMARPLLDTAGEILAYYASVVGDTPYPDATVAAVEWRLPGGHSPAYMAVLNQPLPGLSPSSFRNDPGYFDDFPEFFMAHELAHQWWGQAVGWKNYHEQWLSEGLSQYLAALYAERSRGRETFDSIMRRFHDTSMDAAGQGPIYLGYRVGHIQGDSRLFRAVVYNKSAVVLHMLRRLLGDEAFFRGLRRYYATWRFKKAGSDDLRRAMELESGQVLDRFFERWIYGDQLPSFVCSARVEDGAAGPEAVVRLTQSGPIFDAPVTVTLEYEDRSVTEVLVKVTGESAEARIPLAARLRKVEVNRDHAALGNFTVQGLALKAR